ncbi:MAG: hypothetical protein IKX76_04200, partial [Eubacterium sp.]|nr:hypothetical protein [Eubacterium sp.]
MARQIVNYELFTHRREELRRIEKLRLRRRKMRMLGIGIILLFLCSIVYVIQQSRCDYYKYTEEIKTEENSGVSYETFAGGFLKYSSNGIEFQREFGVARWNIALSYNKPFLAKSGKYLFLGDKGGNQAILFDTEGEIQRYTFKYPIVQLDVAQNGNIAVILEADDCNYVEVYTEDGAIIAETKTTLDETGYPLAAALSPDGTELAVSYYVVEDLVGKSRATFYDFSRQLQQDTIPLKGGFDYENALVPKLRFLRKDRMIAYGNDATHFYNTSGEPREIKAIRFDAPVESIFNDDSYFGYVCKNEDAQKEKYQIYLYNRNGNQRLSTSLDLDYDKVFMVGGDIVATKDNTCTIINQNGNILYQGTLEGGQIEKVLPCPGWRTYRVVFKNKIVKLRLSFFPTK